MESNKISTSGYGFVLLSPFVFEQCRKEFKVRSKKMISYFSKNNEFFYMCVKNGALLPIHHLHYDSYELLFSVGKYKEDLLHNWDIKAIWKNFNLQVDKSQTIWALEIDEMEKWNLYNIVNKERIEGVYYDINDNEFIENKGIKFNLPENKYDVTIYGLQRKIKTKEGIENYGFLFELNIVDTFTSEIDPSEVDFRNLYE